MAAFSDKVRPTPAGRASAADGLPSERRTNASRAPTKYLNSNCDLARGTSNRKADRMHVR